MPEEDRPVFGRFEKVVQLSLAVLALGGCSTLPEARSLALPANGCPVAGVSWQRWNDAYGLNVVAMVQAVPGWVFDFSTSATVIDASPGETGEVKLELVPRAGDVRHPRRTSDQHIYGYWPHADLGAKPNWVQVQCGKVLLGRFRNTPRDSFNPEPPEPPPTFPPPPPPRAAPPG